MKRVLIMEDNTALALEWKSAFELNNAAVTVCSNGEEGLAFLEKYTFDLVITDMFVNEGSGGLHILLKLFKMGQSAPPAIAVTGARGTLAALKERNMFLEQARRLGATGHILKPFPAAELVIMAQDLWAKQALED